MPAEQRENLTAGLVWLATAAVVMYLINPAFFLTTDVIESSIEYSNSSRLILAAILYSLVKTAGALPLLLGSFSLGKFIIGKAGLHGGSITGFWVNLIAAVTLYTLVFALMGHPPDIFVPLLVAGFVLSTAEPQHSRLRLVHKVTVTMQLLLGSFWLDLCPFLDRFGPGQDEIAVSIKLAAIYLNSVPVMNFISMSFFIPLMLTAITTSVLINNHYQQLKNLKAAKAQEEELQKYRLQSVQVRSLQEMHSLVHDLKTPLMTIGGLSSLMQMKYAREEKDGEYFRRIERSVSNMNEMISEILYAKTRRLIPVPDLVNYVRAQVVPEKLEQEIAFHVPDDLPPVRVNRVRLARAMINLLENAMEATRGKKDARIDIGASRDAQTVCIYIADNGTGIATENLERIWVTGFSTRNTPGLGLPFVKNVIDDHGGIIAVESQAGEGTKFKIFLQGEIE